MNRLEGFWYPQNSSARFAAELFLQNSSYRLAAESHSEITGGACKLSFSDRVGNIPRKVNLPDGSIFETKENDLIDTFLVGHAGQSGFSGFIHRLESQWRWTLISLLITIVFSIILFRSGIPWAAQKIAHTLPAQANQIIAAGTLETLDRILLEESELSEDKKEQLTQQFHELIPTDEQGYTFKLHFRSMMDAPNAFALPSGDIVITDSLVRLAEHDEEIDSILLHEMGHVVYRHGLQQIIHASIISFSITMISGDATDMNQFLIAFPAFLAQQKYSRDHETEADSYAFERMKTLGMNPKYFASIMSRLMEVAEGNDSGEGKESDRLSEYLATHPATQDRVRRALEASW